MKKMLLILGKIALAIVLFLLTYVILALAIPYISVNTEDVESAEDIAIYIKTNGVHTDLVVPIQSKYKDWSQKIKFEQTKGQDSTMQYLGFGWGDKGFYLDTPEWSDLKFSTAFVAAFGIGSSAMHATFYKHIDESNDCIKINVSAAEYRNLVAFIEEKFDHDENGNPIYIDATTYGENDVFYEAKGAYNFFYTCNTWANNGLKTMDQKAALWTPTDFGIFQHYR